MDKDIPVVKPNIIHLKLKPLVIDEDGVGTIEVWEKINQIVFIINELNLGIAEDDIESLKKWANFMEKNK